MNQEERIHNLEVAIVALLAIIDTEMSPSTSDAANRMMNDFFNSSETMGAFKKDTFEVRK